MIEPKRIAGTTLPAEESRWRSYYPGAINKNPAVVLGRCSDPCVCSNIYTYRASSHSDIVMTVTTLSSREFNQDTSRAKKAAAKGPVFITDRGKPAHVLLSIEDYRRLTGGRRSIADALAMPGVEEIEFDPPRSNIGVRPADLS